MQWDKPLAASIDRLYQAGSITKQTVYNCVGAGLVSADDYERIVGEEYNVVGT